jgi:hypothetical protein
MSLFENVKPLDWNKLLPWAGELSSHQQMARNNMLFACPSGSALYGTTTPTSDKDYVGVFIPNEEYLIGLGKVDEVEMGRKISQGEQNSAEDIDFKAYALHKFTAFALQNNPNILELLFVKKEQAIVWTPAWDAIQADVDNFLDRDKIVARFCGYATAQKVRMHGNKEDGIRRKELCDKYGYDIKNGSHVVRLLDECISLLLERHIDFPLARADYMKEIKSGAIPLDDLMKEADRLEILIHKLGMSVPNFTSNQAQVERNLILVTKAAIRS